jgi:hypothetical protein
MDKPRSVVLSMKSRYYVGYGTAGDGQVKEGHCRTCGGFCAFAGPPVKAMADSREKGSLIRLNCWTGTERQDERLLSSLPPRYRTVL